MFGDWETKVRICLDARCATSTANSGVRQYATELVRALAASDTENDYVVIVGRGSTERIVEQRNFSEIKLSGRVDSPLGFLSGSRRIRRIGADIYHSLYHVLPFGVRGRTIVTFHDYMRRAENSVKTQPTLSTRFSASCSRITANSTLRRADHIITVSQYVADHVAAMLNHGSRRITVSHTGIDPLFSADTSGAPSDHRERPRFLAMGQIYPPRHVSRVVAAMALIRESTPGATLEIVANGESDSGLKTIISTLSLEDCVTIVQNLPPAALREKMRSATALVYPELDETHGTPVLKAQAAGCPVITADRGPIPEFAGNAALLVDASDTWVLADAMERIYYDTDERDRLIRDGYERARGFTWVAAAERTLGVYERLMRQKRALRVA